MQNTALVANRSAQCFYKAVPEEEMHTKKTSKRCV